PRCSRVPRSVDSGGRDEPAAPVAGVADRLRVVGPPAGGATPWRVLHAHGRVLRLDAFAEHLQRFAPQLRDARLGDVEELRELKRALALEEVADDDDAVPLRQQAHGVTQVAEQLAGFELLGRLARRAV